MQQHAISLKEERANALTHALGALAALLGGIVLIVFASSQDDPWRLASAIVFSSTLLLLYTSSAFYHAATAPARKTRFKVLDHCAIYLLIAGTYTPFTLIGLRGPLGWWMFGLVWTLALAGVVFKLFFTGRFKLLSTSIYIVMGWISLLAIKPIMAALDTWTLGWLLAGGVAYTLGTVFYHRPSMRYSHAVWHLFCIVGSACHYVAVLAQIEPSA